MRRLSTTGRGSNANTGTCTSMMSSTGSPTCNSQQESLPLPLKRSAADRAAALHVYDVCRALLATEMQTEPTAETVALASHMRAVTPPRRKEARTPPGASPPAALLNGPLLGRTTELSTLTKVYHTM